MNKKGLVNKLGIAALAVGIPALMTITLVNQEKQRQKIIENPAKFVEYTVKRGDCISELVSEYSNVPSSLDPRNVWAYVKEINEKETSGLYPGEKIELPVYGKGEK